MTTFLLIFLIALTVTFAGTPWVRRFAIWAGFVDTPEKRKLHAAPMPLMGGVAIFAGAVIAILLLGFREIRPVSAPQVKGILLAGTLIAGTGLLDDRRGLPARVKLAAQLTGVFILIYFGVHVRLPVPLWANYLITVVWIVGISNAINFLDNMDGLSAGLSAVAAAFITLLGALNDQYLVSGLAAAVLGACLGFLRYNFKPATIFMGDAGALFLGFLLAVLGIQMRFSNTNIVTWMVPVFILGVPIFDMTLVVISRLRRGVSPNTPGRDHISHRLVELGFSQREAVLILYLLGGVWGIVGIFVTEASIIEGYAIGAVAVALSAYAIWWLERHRGQVWEDQTAVIPPARSQK